MKLNTVFPNDNKNFKFIVILMMINTMLIGGGTKKHPRELLGLNIHIPLTGYVGLKFTQYRCDYYKPQF